MSNPLKSTINLPNFKNFNPKTLEADIDAKLADVKQGVENLLNNLPEKLTWQNFQLKLDELYQPFSKLWSLASHLNSVMNNPTLREEYNKSLPKVSEYTTWYSQNKTLYNAYLSFKKDADFKLLSTEQQKVIKNSLRDFKLSGIGLPDDEQNRYKDICKRLAELSSKFSDNVLDATAAWSKHIQDEKILYGLPDTTKLQAAQKAKDKELGGWVLTLDFPCYYAVITYCSNRSLREEVYKAYNTRCSISEIDPTGRYDNTAQIDEIVALKQELANLLGFENYAQYSLATKMVNRTDDVINFLEDLVNRVKEPAVAELKSLASFASKTHNISSLEAWDIAFYSEKEKQKKFSIDQEALKPWFVVDTVLNGFFNIINRLFGINFVEKKDLDVWHQDVRTFALCNQKNEVIAYCYIDLFARENKRSGAWMDECCTRYLGSDGILNLPAAYLVTNFTPPVEGKPALLTHDEVLTLFHEFGHGLHHMLTKIESLEVSGIHGVPWDAVELPSQFMEHWCWQKDALRLISSHFETKTPLAEEKLEQLVASKNYHSAMHLCRQLEFALFDFRLHMSQYANCEVQKLLDKIRKQVAVIIPPPYVRFQNSFSHIFAGGYAAGYYSYLWADVLCSDAFSLFEEQGIFDQDTGMKFLNTILEKGGSEEPMQLFKDFRGRKPSIDAFLRHSGIV